MALIDDNRDDSLERDPRLARLYQAAAGEEPPAALDAAILAAARREVGARPQVMGGGGDTGATPVRVGHVKRNWYVPVSIAAVLVLSVSLVTLVHQEKGDELAQPPAMMSGPQSASEPPKTSAPATVPAADAPAAVALSGKAGLMRRDAVPAKPKVVEEKRTEPAKAIDAMATRQDQPEPFPAASEREAPAPASRDAMEARTRNETDRGVTRGAMQESPVTPATPLAAAPRRAVPAEDALAQSAPSQAESRVFATPPPPAAKAAPPPPAAKPALRLMEKRPLLWRGLEDQPPEKWLERLTEFRRDGRQADADELWAEFRRRFPDHPASQR